VADLAGGTTAAYAISAALFARERSGTGAVLDLAILDIVTAWMGFHLEAERAGVGSEIAALPLSGRYPFYNVYETADGGWVALGALEPLFWHEFCRAVGRPDLADLQFVDGVERDRVFDDVRAIFRSDSTAGWRAFIASHGLAAEVVAGPEAVQSDPQLAARRMLIHVRHPTAGDLTQVASPIPTPGSTADVRPPPDLGQHTREVLGEVLDLTEVEVDNLLERRIVFETSAPGRRIAPETIS
jgi:crotonobetainyl-CoA:carnitine CoA-transferase CaiB-like acyl-CoA transferase